MQGCVSSGTCFLSSLWSFARATASATSAEGQREHVLVELAAREVVGELGVRVRAVHPTRVGERDLLVAEPVALEDDLGADDVEALSRVL